MSKEENRQDYGTVKMRSWGEVTQNGLHKENLEQSDALTIVKPFIIKECDLLTIKRFVNYCRRNSKNDWGTGLKMLLDESEADAKNMMLYSKIKEIEQKIEGEE